MKEILTKSNRELLKVSTQCPEDCKYKIYCTELRSSHEHPSVNPDITTFLNLILPLKIDIPTLKKPNTYLISIIESCPNYEKAQIEIGSNLLPILSHLTSNPDIVTQLNQAILLQSPLPILSWEPVLSFKTVQNK